MLQENIDNSQLDDFSPDYTSASSTGIEKLARFFLYAAVATIPLVSLSAERKGLTSQWVRIVASDIFGFVAIITCLISGLQRRCRPFLMYSIPFLVWVVLGIVIAWARLDFYGSPLIIRVINIPIFLYVFFLSGICCRLVKDEQIVKHLLIAFLVGATIESIVIIHDGMGVLGMGSVWFMDRAEFRLRGTFRANGQLGQYGVAMLFFCYAFSAWPGISGKLKSFSLGLSVVGGLGTYFAVRRSGVLCIILWIGMLIFRSFFMGTGRKSIFSVVILLVLGFGIVGYSLTNQGLSEWFSGEYQAITPSSLANVYEEGGWFRGQVGDSWEIITSYPILGCGAGNAIFLTSNHAEIHNGFFAILAETGVFGAILMSVFLVHLGLVVRNTYRLAKGTPWGDFIERLTISFIAWIPFSIHNRLWRDRSFWIAVIIIFAMEVVLIQYHQSYSYWTDDEINEYEMDEYLMSQSGKEAL